VSGLKTEQARYEVKFFFKKVAPVAETRFAMEQGFCSGGTTKRPNRIFCHLVYVLVWLSALGAIFIRSHLHVLHIYLKKLK
jgi:hypothetical protein